MSAGKFDVINGYAALKAGGPLEKWSYKPRPLGTTDVEIKVAYCGICGSDVHAIDSEWNHVTFPIIVGHEIIGTVTAVGSNVTHLKAGDRVGVGAQCDACLNCIHCKKGHDNNCFGRVFTYNGKYKSDGAMSQGGYAEAVRVPSQYAFKLPEKLPSDVAAPLLCAGVTVWQPLRKYMHPFCRVGVIGIGGLGHLAVQFAAKLGATSVVAITSSSGSKKDDCFKLGATDVLDIKDDKSVKNWSNKLDVIICTANSSTLPWDKYLSLLNNFGTFVIVGLPEAPISLNVMPIVMKQLVITGSLIGGRADIEEMLQFAAEKEVKPWIEVKKMDEVNEAIQKVRDNQARYRMVLKND
ncbi:putative alcohol dehydrogenase [Paraphysoderma sedebokerense]|nr:putative alcohol dehydrogenase [Paraphysoderma sedebokerense]